MDLQPEDAFEVVDVLAQHGEHTCRACGGWGAARVALQRGQGHARQLVGHGLHVVAAGVEPEGDPVEHAEHREGGDAGIDRALEVLAEEL